MPLIHIRSLPYAPGALDVPRALEAISQDFAGGSGVALAHVTVTWSFFEPGHYAHAGRTETHQPQHSHPLLVDVLSPDLDGPARVEELLERFATAVSIHGGVPRRNVFVVHRSVAARTVFDEGSIVDW